MQGGFYTLLVLLAVGPVGADVSAFVAAVGFDQEANLDGGAGFGLRWGKSSSIIGGETSLMIARPTRQLATSEESATAIFYEARLLINIPLGSDIQPFFGVGFSVQALARELQDRVEDSVGVELPGTLVEDRTVQYNELSFGLNFRF